LDCRHVCKTCAFHDAVQAGKQKDVRRRQIRGVRWMIENILDTPRTYRHEPRLFSINQHFFVRTLTKISPTVMLVFKVIPVWVSVSNVWTLFAKAAAKILNKHSWTADKRWAFKLGVGRNANKSPP
jgi:hypothetical protein